MPAIIIIIIVVIVNLFSPTSYQVAVSRQVQISTTDQSDLPHTLQMQCAVLISVIFCSSIADG